MKQTRYLPMIDQPFPDERPLVSIIISAYNVADCIERTLSSVLSQTYHHLQILVIDDGSNDHSAIVVEAIAQRDPRVILLRQPNFGVARNLGIGQIKGKFIAPIDTDDWYPAQLRGQIASFLSRSAAVGVVYSWSSEFRSCVYGTCVYGKGIRSYYLTTLFSNRDWRALLSLFVGLPTYYTQRIFLRLLKQISYPLSLLLAELRGKLGGSFGALEVTPAMAARPQRSLGSSKSAIFTHPRTRPLVSLSTHRYVQPD